MQEPFGKKEKWQLEGKLKPWPEVTAASKTLDVVRYNSTSRLILKGLPYVQDPSLFSFNKSQAHQVCVAWVRGPKSTRTGQGAS